MNVEYIAIIRISIKLYNHNSGNMTNYNVLVHDNIKRSITLFNIGIIAEFWFISW